MSDRRDIGIIVCGHIGIGTTITALVETMHKELGVEVILVGLEREPEKEFEFKNRTTPIDIIQVVDLPIDLFGRESKIYGKQKKVKNYYNPKKQFTNKSRNRKIVR